MLISPKACEKISKLLESGEKTISCSSLFLSAKWVVLSQIAKKGIHLAILPDKESAEYCCADLYSFVDGDRVFFLPESGKNVERSNYKSSLAVQRTSALSELMNTSEDKLSIIVSYPEAISESVPAKEKAGGDIFILKKGDEISHDALSSLLYEKGFEKVDFVSEPGQYALTGSIADVFSYSNNLPYRISFWGDEVDTIH